MAFVRYQKVRNRVLGVFAAIGATVGGIFGYQSISQSGGTTDPVAARSAGADWQDNEPTAVPQAYPSTSQRATRLVNPQPATQEFRTNSGTQIKISGDGHVSPQVAAEMAALADQRIEEHLREERKSQQKQTQRQPTTAERYCDAMKFANSNSRRAAKAKDVLGSRSPWKLNLYDDNQDGTWDRAKLDTNRDEVDDEKWTFKNGYWEKENGTIVWASGKWVTKSALTRPTTGSAADRKLARYRTAFKTAMARANPSGKGKDVLGSESPWKLNLYDDDRDGQWDRAKLDTNSDEVDDEKWTFKKGRWEKNNGQLVWANNNWVAASSISKPATPTTDLGLYRAAFDVANARADKSGKGKDVLGGKSPWKLNLYDDDRDGQWDRAKLDTNRDDVDDEKWTFKNSRWEKENGSKVWAGDRWESAKALSSAINKSSNPMNNRYRRAMQLANGKANRSGKGKDVLGGQSPWKLNLYDDDRDGTWDRAKLDTNRDDVDDEKWNFKNGRWEKDGGSTIWNGERWVK